MNAELIMNELAAFSRYAQNVPTYVWLACGGIAIQVMILWQMIREARFVRVMRNEMKAYGLRLREQTEEVSRLHERLERDMRYLEDNESPHHFTMPEDLWSEWDEVQEALMAEGT